MLKRREWMLALCVMTAALGCGKTRSNNSLSVRNPDGGVLPDGGEEPTGTGGKAHVATGGRGATPGTGGRGVTGSGGMVVPGSGGRAPQATGGRTGGGGGAIGISGFGGNIGVGGAVGTGGFYPGTGGYFPGTGGYYIPDGGIAGSGGSGNQTPCVWSPGCTYPNGNTCDGNYCCYLSGDRCCDSIGRCGDPIPPPGDWKPPIDSSRVGAPGWKQSTDPFCPGGMNPYGTSIWSDSRGVFVTATRQSQNDDPKCPYCQMEDVQFNDGTGWKSVAGSSDYGQMRVRGVDGGALMLFGYSQVNSPMGESPMPLCGLSVLKDGTRTCEPVDGVSDVTVINDHSAYASLQGNLVVWDGTHWSPESVPMPGNPELTALWASDNAVYGTGQTPGKILSLKGGVWKAETTNTLETFSAIYGLSDTSVFAGTAQEHLYHYDGNAWGAIDWSGSGCSISNQQYSPIVSIWGKGSVVYFATQTAIARWNGSTVEIIARWPCDMSGNAVSMIAALWGNSENELFVLMYDNRDPRQTCGPTYVLYYDGSKFHRM